MGGNRRRKQGGDRKREGEWEKGRAGVGRGGWERERRKGVGKPTVRSHGTAA